LAFVVSCVVDEVLEVCELAEGDGELGSDGVGVGAALR